MRAFALLAIAAGLAACAAADPLPVTVPGDTLVPFRTVLCRGRVVPAAVSTDCPPAPRAIGFPPR